MRNLLLAVRLIHFHEKIPDVKLNIKHREKQLFKPIIRIFQNAQTLNELLPVISKYVTQRREANFSNLHSFLYRAVRDMIRSKNTFQLESGFIWDYIRNVLHGADIRLDKYLYNAEEKLKLKTKTQIRQYLDIIIVIIIVLHIFFIFIV